MKSVAFAVFADGGCYLVGSARGVEERTSPGAGPLHRHNEQELMMRIKRALAGAMAALMAMTLVACGGGGAEGDWVIDKDALKKQMNTMLEKTFKDAADQGMSEDQIKMAKEMAGKQIDKQLESTDATLTFKGDGTITVSGKLFGEEAKKNLGGKWKQDGTTITITDGDGDDKKEMKGELKDGKMHIKIDDPNVPEDFELVLKRK